MGSHACPYCESDEGDRFSRESSGTVTLEMDNGVRVYVLPDMFLHYVEKHFYKPPQQFIDDVMKDRCTGGKRVQYRSSMTIAEPMVIGFLHGDFGTGPVPEGFVEKLLALMIKYDPTGNVKNFVCKTILPPGGNLRKDDSEIHKVRKDWLEEHSRSHPEWSAVVEILIEKNCFVVIPAGKGWQDGDVLEQDLLVLEPGVKGPPAAYRINGEVVECVNYPGSFEPMSFASWILMVMDLADSIVEKNDWIEEILSQ